MKFLLLLGTSCLALATATDGIVWSNPPNGYTACGKVTTVFGVKVCVTTNAFQKNKSKCEHVVNVFYQLLDNNADGFVDDAAVHNEMVSNNYLLFVPNTEQESERDGWPDSVGVAQMTGIFETIPNTCDVPTNRGASATDRATWSNKRDTSNNPNGCSNERDATTEEILHLITSAASAVYPEKWAPTWNSAAGRAVKLANGNCGWGYTGDWKDPSSSTCNGQYAYDDKTCDANCLIVEGIYWASVSYIGGLYTKERASGSRREWLMATPDATMNIEPPSINNAVSLQDGSPALYALVSDTTSTGHAWLPEIMPDGKYQGFANGPTQPGPTPTKKPTKAPTLKPPTNEPVNSPPSDDDAPPGSGTDDESPSGSEDEDDAPPGSGTDDESPSGSEDEDDAPPGSGTDDESLSGSDDEDDAPPGSGTDDESFSGSEDQDDAPPGSGTDDASPSGSEDEDDAPPGSGTDDESPSGSEDEDDSPPGSGTDDESPSGSEDEDDAPPGSGTDDASPSGSEDEDDAPPGSGTDDESPSGSEDEDDAPPGSGTDDASPSGSEDEDDVPPGSGTNVGSLSGSEDEGESPLPPRGSKKKTKNAKNGKASSRLRGKATIRANPFP